MLLTLAIVALYCVGIFFTFVIMFLLEYQRDERVGHYSFKEAVLDLTSEKPLIYDYDLIRIMIYIWPLGIAILLVVLMIMIIRYPFRIVKWSIRHWCGAEEPRPKFFASFT